MRIICAPDKFKGSLTATQAAQAMSRGVARALPQAEVDLCPVADGGEGFTQAMIAATGGAWQTTAVAGPREQTVQARWGLIARGKYEGPLAVIDMATAAGLELLPPAERDPTQTSTYGVGQLLLAALDAGAREILLGIGGSATNDGGCGAAQALGVRFYDRRGLLMDQPITGGRLHDIARIDNSALDSRMLHTPLVVACDVSNPLTGPQGAAFIYGPQKGAHPAQVLQLDVGLKHLAQLWREQLRQDVENVPGAGAAGGLGGGLLAYCSAQLERGVNLVLAAVRFGQRVKGCDLCLTGEGRLDGSTLSGKVCAGVAQSAKAQGVPVVALVGSRGQDAGAGTLERLGIVQCVEIGSGLPAEESMRRAAELLEQAACRAVEIWSRR